VQLLQMHLLLVLAAKQGVLRMQVAAAAVGHHAQEPVCTGSCRPLGPAMHLQDPRVCQIRCCLRHLGQQQPHSRPLVAATADTPHRQQRLQVLLKIKPWQLAAAAAVLEPHPAMLLRRLRPASLRLATGAS
jgi:hypothetical protein